METSSSVDPADLGAAASGATGSFENVEGDDQCKILDGADEVNLQTNVPHDADHQEGNVRVRGTQQGQYAGPAAPRPPTTVSSGNDIGPSVSQINTPERRGQVDLPPDSWQHPQAHGPPRQPARG